MLNKAKLRLSLVTSSHNYHENDLKKKIVSTFEILFLQYLLINVEFIGFANLPTLFSNLTIHLNFFRAEFVFDI